MNKAIPKCLQHDEGGLKLMCCC